MTCNIVLVFQDMLSSKYSWNVQVRSQNEENNKPALQFKLYIEKRERGGKIWATIPKIRDPIPIIILFRALGVDSDKDIFNMVMSDPDDTAMSEAFRPSLEQAISYESPREMPRLYCVDELPVSQTTTGTTNPGESRD